MHNRHTDHAATCRQRVTAGHEPVPTCNIKSARYVRYTCLWQCWIACARPMPSSMALLAITRQQCYSVLHTRPHACPRVKLFQIKGWQTCIIQAAWAPHHPACFLPCEYQPASPGNCCDVCAAKHAIQHSLSKVLYGLQPLDVRQMCLPAQEACQVLFTGLLMFPMRVDTRLPARRGLQHRGNARLILPVQLHAPAHSGVL